MVNTQPFGNNQVVSPDHIIISIFGEFHMQPITGLAGLAVTDVVCKDDEVFGGIEQLTGPEKAASETRGQKIPYPSCSAVHDQYGVVRLSVFALMGRAKGSIVEAELRQDLFI